MTLEGTALSSRHPRYPAIRAFPRMVGVPMLIRRLQPTSTFFAKNGGRRLDHALKTPEEGIAFFYKVG